MPNQTPSVETISAELNEGEWSPEGLTFEMAVNSFPTVRAEVAQTSGDVSVLEPVSQDVLSRIGEMQASRLAGRTESDFKLTAQDGKGGELYYEGFLSAPVLELTRTSSADSLSSVGLVAMIDALDLSIYASDPDAVRKESSRNLLAVPPAKDGNITQTMLEITEALVSNYDLTMDLELETSMKALLERQHSINTGGALGVWKAILNANDVEFKSWSEAFNECSEIAENLSEYAKRMLTTATPGFWNKVSSAMSAFQLYYVPSFSGYGRFERADAKTGDPIGDLELSVLSFSVGDGNQRLMQPGGVVMVGAGPKTDRGEASATVPRICAYAPDPLLDGFIQREPVPLWLTRAGNVPIIGSSEDKSGDASESVNLSLADRAARKTSGLAHAAKVAAKGRGIMSEMCEVMFSELQLAHSTASATVPLDFSLNDKIGQRYTVKIAGKNGESGSFSAFVHSINHGVDLRNGRELNSYTRINFSHAKYG